MLNHSKKTIIHKIIALMFMFSDTKFYSQNFALKNPAIKRTSAEKSQPNPSS
jgi:hypothetical protein